MICPVGSCTIEETANAEPPPPLGSTAKTQATCEYVYWKNGQCAGRTCEDKVPRVVTTELLHNVDGDLGPGPV